MPRASIPTDSTGELFAGPRRFADRRMLEHAARNPDGASPDGVSPDGVS
jgi:hypothetical protein